MPPTYANKRVALGLPPAEGCSFRPQRKPHGKTMTKTARRTNEQLHTARATLVSIMRTRAFRRGFDEARKGVAFDWRVGGNNTNANEAWHYERGRLFAHIAPLDMALCTNGRLNPNAIALCDAAFRRDLIL